MGPSRPTRKIYVAIAVEECLHSGVDARRVESVSTCGEFETGLR